MNKQTSNKLKKHIDLIRNLTLENIMLKHTIEKLNEEKPKCKTLNNKKMNKDLGFQYNKKTPVVLFYIHKKFF